MVCPNGNIVLEKLSVHRGWFYSALIVETYFLLESAEMTLKWFGCCQIWSPVDCWRFSL